jgi:hypothetical protein
MNPAPTPPQVPGGLKALAYLSTASHILEPQQLDHLLLESRRFNQKLGITGVLLYCQGNFFQYLEGEETPLQTVFRRVLASSLHRDLYMLLPASDIHQRHFAQWHMGYSEPPPSLLAQLSQALWVKQAQALPHQPDPAAPGMVLLKSFWIRNQRLGSSAMGMNNGDDAPSETAS